MFLTERYANWKLSTNGWVETSITHNAIGIEQLLPKNNREITIVDLGCGGGDMLRMIDSWGKKENLKLNLIGIDANPNIVAFAKRNLTSTIRIFNLRTLNIFSEEFQKQQYDIVIGTLFYHHFSRRPTRRIFLKGSNNK